MWWMIIYWERKKKEKSCQKFNNIPMSTYWQAAIPGGSGEKRKDMQRGRDRLMGWWYEKLTRSVRSFDKMPINQSLSPVNLNPFLSQAFSFARIHPLSRLAAVPRPVFLSRPPVSLFNGSVTLTTTPHPRPSISHTPFMSIPLSSSPTLFHSLRGFFFFCAHRSPLISAASRLPLPLSLSVTCAV